MPAQWKTKNKSYGVFGLFPQKTLGHFPSCWQTSTLPTNTHTHTHLGQMEPISPIWEQQRDVSSWSALIGDTPAFDSLTS